jgi:hypothetical protein
MTDDPDLWTGARVQSTADELLRLGCLDYADWNPELGARARAMVAADRGLARDSIYTAAACGDVDHVRAELARDPSLARTRGGSHGWMPLLYACYARIDPPGGSTLEVARVLLAAGADPDAGFLWNGNVPPFTALTGAFGEGEHGVNFPPHVARDALATMLLDAGADPNDGQTLYNRHFAPDDGHLRLLLAYGLGTERGGPWYARLGSRLDSPRQLLIEELWSAARADYRARVELLVEHGADVDGVGRRDRRSIYATAIRNGNREIAAYLLAHGATPAPPEDAFEAAVVAGDRETALALAPSHPARDPHLVGRAVGARRVAALRLMAELGYPFAGNPTLPLHGAAWRGDVALVELLLELGADPAERDPEHDGTPLGWARYNHQQAVVELLERLPP